MRHEIRYGKADVKVYRTHAEPLTGITPIPESPFSGRENLLAAAEIEVIVRGTQFLDAYTKGDNRLVVATDTMKNFIHAVSLRARARALEEWLLEVGTAFLDTYPHMERLTMVGRDLPFPAALVPAADGDGFEASDRLFSRDRSDYGSARLELARDASGGVEITDHESGRRELQLIKITGSAFADFARDEHTTLPERRDRPAVHLVRHRLDLHRCVARRPRGRIEVRRLGAGRRPRERRLPRVRVALDPAPRQRDRHSHARPMAAARVGQLRRPEPAVGRRRRGRRRHDEDLRRPAAAVRAHRPRPEARRLSVAPIIAGWSIAGHRSMTTSRPASAASCAASSFQTSSCIQTAFAPISIASSTCGMTRSERRKRSTTSIGASRSAGPSGGRDTRPCRGRPPPSG